MMATFVVAAVLVLVVIALIGRFFGVILVVPVIVLSRPQPLFLGGVFGLLTKQRVAVRLGDLIIIGVDFAEGQEAVAVSAVIDERRLERRFYPGNLGEIDIAFELLMLSRFEVKLLDPV